MEKPLFSQRGGMRDGWFNITWPFVCLRVFRDRLELDAYRIPKESITSLRRHRGLLTAGLRIESRSVHNPLIFWTFDFDELKDALCQAGYEVSA